MPNIWKMTTIILIKRLADDIVYEPYYGLLINEL